MEEGRDLRQIDVEKAGGEGAGRAGKSGERDGEGSGSDRGQENDRDEEFEMILSLLNQYFLYTIAVLFGLSIFTCKPL